MTDFLNKVVTIILIFVLLVLAPLLISYMATDMVTERLVLNEVTQFIDKVTDKATISDIDLNELYLAVNSHGGMYDVTVKRYIRVAAENDDGTVRTLYYSVDDSSSLNVGDVVKVHIEEIGTSNSKRLLWQLLRIDKGTFEFSLAGTVR